jgi:hypothetical protein
MSYWYVAIVRGDNYFPFCGQGNEHSEEYREKIRDRGLEVVAEYFASESELGVAGRRGLLRNVAGRAGEQGFDAQTELEKACHPSLKLSVA